MRVLREAAFEAAAFVARESRAARRMPEGASSGAEYGVARREQRKACS